MIKFRALALLMAALAAPAADSQHPLFRQIDALTRSLSEITGFGLRRAVPYAMINRRELRAFLERRIHEEVKPEEIRIEEMLLKKFGLVPPDFDLKRTTIELYTEQAAAFYDFKRRKLFILESDDAALQQAALVHELAHALADQHFRLHRFLQRAGPNDDGALARLAVMEGQASYLMAELTARNLGQSLENSPELLDLMSRMIGAAPGESPVFDRSPLYLRESLLFPYTAGMRFQHAVIQKKGREGFREVFRRPPESTQQVLHPEKYLSGISAVRLAPPELAARRSYRKLAEGTVGEFDYAVLLRQYVGEEAARRIAPAWRGGAYRLLEHRREQRTALVQVSLWESDRDAQAFVGAYRKVLEGKWKRFEASSEAPGRLAGRGDDGFFLLRRDGAYVYCFEGFSAPLEWPQATAAALRTIN